MKAEELMIGDWMGWLPTWKNEETGEIEWDGDRNDPIIGKVGMLMKDCTTIDYCDESIEVEDIGLIPIPLTPEILEKNGFRYDGSGQRSMMLMTPFGESGTRWNLYVGLKHKTIDVFSAPPVEKSSGWRKCNKVYLEVCGCFVHELQHALRLCGIEKEIVL